MELRIIEDDILRVKLTRLDMLKYDIDCSSLDYKNTRTRKAVWDILDEAYEKTGFDAAKGRIYIEAYPDKIHTASAELQALYLVALSTHC